MTLYLPCRLLTRSMRRNPSSIHGRLFSTSSSSASSKDNTTHNNKNNSTNARITKTLYRQLLRWSKTAPKIPLTTLIPPVHLESPDSVDAFRLEVLTIPASKLDDPVVAKVRRMLPPQTELTRTYMTIPLHSIDDVRNVVRAVFRLNSGPETLPEHLKVRLSATFTALKSLNELSGGLAAIENQRQAHQDRSGVQFYVGQVVQHQVERWRGVIASWSRSSSPSTTDPTQRTSLTTKDYNQVMMKASEPSTSPPTNITYDVILDTGDEYSRGTSSGWSQAPQSDLQLVNDSALLRVHSNILKDYFTVFNADHKRFVPNKLVEYQFPSDEIAQLQVSTVDTADAKMYLEMVVAAQSLAQNLRRCILDETSCPKERKLTLLDYFLEKLDAIAAGNVFSRQEIHLLSQVSSSPSPMTTVAHHLRALLYLHLEVMDINYQRRLSKENKPKIKFGLGDIVKHTKYGFRGVVVTWDPKPVLDVRRWDGLRDIENPMEKPFYHIIPDQNDCIKAFGGERPARYVCEDNLEACPTSERNDLNIDMEPVWTKTEEGYEAPQAIKFRFGEDLDDNGMTERCLTRIQDEFNSLYLLARQPNASDPLASKLSVERLLKFLAKVDNAADASAIQDTLKEYMKAHSRRELRWRLESGMIEMYSGKGMNAMDIYETVLGEDPTYTEAWNKLATCQYMNDEFKESMEATKKALQLDPNHIQAVCGLGLIHLKNGNYQEAVKYFRKALSLDPWTPVGAKLSLSLDLLDRIITRDEVVD